MWIDTHDLENWNVNLYVSTNESSDEIKSNFYNLLQDTINKKRIHDIKLLI